MTLNVGCLDLTVRSGGAGRRAIYSTNPPTHYASIQNSCVAGRSNAVVLDRTKGTNQIILKGTCPTSGEVAVTITIHDPALYAATVLAETLESNGIKVKGKIARDRAIRKEIGKLTVLAAHETPLARALERANKDSSNPYAEALCKRTGFAASGVGSWSAGSAASAAFLKKIGVDPAEFTLDDGSGLSRENRLSAATLARVLQYDFHGKNRGLFLSSLSVAGQDGTLDDRFKATDLRGRVFGKSGYIVGVSALSGYVQTRDGWTIVFSILMNDLRGGNARAKQLQETIVKAIDATSK
jgi:D-alanyl-D-alanine carboxypeptidase/D-alanyl-D-alanine-endopeptidase (penicillin-binding protein 4)